LSDAATEVATLQTAASDTVDVSDESDATILGAYEEDGADTVEVSDTLMLRSESYPSMVPIP
jgi:hypothetical protein